MNRRSFLSDMLKAGVACMVLPGAARRWKATPAGVLTCQEYAQQIIREPLPKHFFFRADEFTGRWSFEQHFVDGSKVVIDTARSIDLPLHAVVKIESGGITTRLENPRQIIARTGHYSVLCGLRSIHHFS